MATMPRCDCLVPFLSQGRLLHRSWWALPLTPPPDCSPQLLLRPAVPQRPPDNAHLGREGMHRAYRRSQDIRAFGIIKRREFAPAIAVKQLNLLARVPPTARGP